MEPVRCGRCGSSNPPENLFCNKCGFPLASEDLQSTEVEIRRLRGLVNQINARLDALEKKPQLIAPPPAQEAPSAIPPEASPETRPAAPPAPVARPTPPQKEPAPKQEREWEQILGGNWLARIGVLALIIGIGFFLKYAFDNDWIGPAARCILGGAAGFIMLGLGFYWRKRYPVLTQVLSGGGIAVFYLSIFASSATYNLIGIYAATALLLAISVLATLLALKYDSIALSIIGIFGAYFAPFILGAFNGAGRVTDSDTQAALLLVYIIVISLGVTVLSTFRNWRWFTLLALFCSAVTYAFWRGEFARTVSTAGEQTGITVIFLVFIMATVFSHLVRRREARPYDHVFLVINAAVFVIFSLVNLWRAYDEWMGLFFLLLAIFYGLLAFFISRRSKENTWLSRFSLAAGLIFLTIAIPVQFRDEVWTPILFAVEMTAGIWLSFALKLSFLRYFSYVLFMVMVWDLLLVNTAVNTLDFTPVINERFLVYIIGIAASYLAFYILQRQRKSLAEWSFIAPYILIITSVITIWLISFEVWDSFSGAISSSSGDAGENLRDARNLSLTAAWAICAVIGLVTGIMKHWRWVRIGSLALLAITIIKVFTFDVFQLETTYRIIAFVGLGVLLLASAYLYQRYRKAIKGVFREQ